MQYFVNMKHRQIKNAVAVVFGGNAGERVSALAPNIIVAIVGTILPSTTKAITAFEAWSPTVQARHDLWRLYLGRILNIFIFVAINVELIAGRPLFGQKEVLAERDKAYQCSENQAATNLLSLVVSEFVLSLALRPLTTLACAYGFHFLFKSFNFSSEFEKPPFDIADYAVDVMYFQCLLWSTAVFVPSLVVVAPCLFFLHFKWLKFTLLALTSRPFVAETAALSVTLLQVNCVSCLCFVGMVYSVATRDLPHEPGCGPFESGVAPAIMLQRINTPGAATVGSILLWCKDHPGVLFPVLALLIFVTLMQRNRSRALHSTLGQLQNASQRHVEALEGELWRMERQNELLSRRVQWHEKTAE